jgi:hypothetical protein
MATFPEAPLRSRTVGFPESGSDLDSPPRAFPPMRRLKRWRAYAPVTDGLPTPYLRRAEPAIPRHCVRAPLRRRRCQVPRAPLPAAGVTYDGAMSSTASKAVTPSSSLIWAHATDRRPLATFGPWPRPASPCRLSPVPAGRWSFPTLSPRAFPRMTGPEPRQLVGCVCPFLPQRHRPSPRSLEMGRRLQVPLSDFRADAFSRPSTFLTFSPPGLLATQVAPTAAITRGAAVAFTSERNTSRYLDVVRTC